MLDQPLASLRKLRVEFQTKDGPVVGVEDVSFDVHAGETVCIVGESGSGKSVSSLSLMRLVEFGGGQIAGGELLFNRDEGGAIDVAKAGDDRDAHDPRQRDRDDLSGADDLAQPGVHHRAAVDRGLARSQGDVEGTGERAGAGSVAAGAYPRTRAAAEAISARVVGGHAPAGGDRHGAGLRAAPV